MAVLIPRSAASLLLALLIALAFSAYGCVFDEKCVGAGVSRGADGKCTATGPVTDGGRMDAGARDGSSPDAPTSDDAGDVDSGTIDVDSGTTEMVVEISTGAAHVCARTNLSALYCRGSNSEGQLATGNVDAVAGPVLVAFDQPVKAIAGAHASVCALTARPAVYCWGSNGNGQVGVGSVGGQITTPSELPSIGNLAAMASSFANTCVTPTGGGSTVCWGRNDVGQVGWDSGMVDVTSPSMPVGRAGGGTLEFVIETAIGDRHTCFRTASLEAFCVGENVSGQLGQAGPNSGVALQVAGLTDVRSIAAAGQHACAVSVDAVYCWGNNEKGQVDPTAPSASIATPTLVPLAAGATQVVTGMETSCALLTTGEVQCWGSRTHGGVGDGIADGSIATPTLVGGVVDIRQISASFVWLTCALSNGGTVSCWGEDGVTLLGGGMDSAVYPDTVTLQSAAVEVPMIP